jgi:hypothetical protein
VKNQNVFQFDDTYWRQYIGTPVGTPCACSYATLSYTLRELRKVLQLFTKGIAFLKHFIDDMLGVWVGTEEKEWVSFKNSLNGFGKLNWIMSERAT